MKNKKAVIYLILLLLLLCSPLILSYTGHKKAADITGNVLFGGCMIYTFVGYFKDRRDEKKERDNLIAIHKLNAPDLIKYGKLKRKIKEDLLICEQEKTQPDSDRFYIHCGKLEVLKELDGLIEKEI